MTYSVTVKVGKDGGSLKATIPTAFAKILEIEDGDDLLVEMLGQTLVLRKK